MLKSNGELFDSLIDPPNRSPQFTRISVVNSTSVELEWNELDCVYGNGAILGYKVRHHQDGEAVNYTLVNVTTTHLTIMNLTALQLYHVSIAAMNTIGIGPYSNNYQIYIRTHL